MALKALELAWKKAAALRPTALLPTPGWATRESLGGELSEARRVQPLGGYGG